MTDLEQELRHMPGLYIEKDPLQVEVLCGIGSVAFAGARFGGQWKINAYSGRDSSDYSIHDEAPPLGIIVTDVEGMSSDPFNNQAPRLQRYQVAPIVAQWLMRREIFPNPQDMIYLRGDFAREDRIGLYMPLA